MAASLLLETTFLIDLERETARGELGPAHALLEGHASSPLFISLTIAGELAAGLSLAERQTWDAFLAPFPLLELTPEVAWRYGQTYRYLQTNGLQIGANDLWIASTALAHSASLVTRDLQHFRRVPGLDVIGY